MDKTPLLQILLPELVLVSVACLLFLLGTVDRAVARKGAATLALLALLAVFLMEFFRDTGIATAIDPFETFRVFKFARFIKMFTAGVGAILVLLAWPSNDRGTGSASIDYGRDTAEFFALMLLAITGVFLSAGANDLILLFLGIELASIPTYIMVSMSRPVAEAQEAGVKYFFLGAMAAALLLFGFSYIYGVTGHTNIYQIMFDFSQTMLVDRDPGGVWWKLGTLMLIAGICFKIAAVPLHFYVGDVYQGAATPVTAFLSFVPKVSGFVALVRVFQLVSAGNWLIAEHIETLFWVLAVLTMTIGNVLALMQLNVKRVLAYSSVAHSGYILVGFTTMAALVGEAPARIDAFQGVLFYLVAYGLMNVAAFAVLALLPGRDNRPTGTAETYEDLAGQGRRHVGLGLAMAVACFSLTGLPLTVGFWGKFLLIKPAMQAAMLGEGRPMMYWLVIITVVNAAISAGYYLKIVGTMFLRDPAAAPPRAIGPNASIDPASPASRDWSPAVVTALLVSVGATLLFGTFVPFTQALVTESEEATRIEQKGFTPVLEFFREIDEQQRNGR